MRRTSCHHRHHHLLLLLLLVPCILLATALLASSQSTPTTTPPTCTVQTYADFARCQTAAIANASTTPQHIHIQGPVTVPTEKNVDWSRLPPGTVVTVSGEVVFEKWTTNRANSLYLFLIGGEGVTFDGAGGVFDGRGQDYWDGLGSNGGVPKPKFFKFSTSKGSVIRNLYVKNAPQHTFRVSGPNTVYDNIVFDNSLGDLQGGHNTDAFDINASNITIQNSWVHNQDDCLAASSGTNIQFLNTTCIGGHGISVGSISTGEQLDGLFVSNCTIADSDNGVRIKTNVNATNAYVRNVVYADVALRNISKYGVVIQQDYLNGGPTGTPTDGVQIANVTLRRVTGWVRDDARFAVYVLCGRNCTGFVFEDLDIRGGNASCSGVVPGGQGCVATRPPPPPSSSSPSGSAWTTSTAPWYGRGGGDDDDGDGGIGSSLPSPTTTTTTTPPPPPPPAAKKCYD
ncbi:putative extracellular polygalacturonase [Zopfochytrium polystomum]|nr:putative extracellular polygalacturonase [Zopfochytrium polystomum]